MPEMSGYMIMVLLLGVLMLGAALYAVSLANLVRAVVCLITTFVILGVFYLLLGSDFFAAVQILLYTGAIAVLVIFVIMLTRKSSDLMEPPENKKDWIWGGVIAAGLFVLIFLSIGKEEIFAVELTGMTPPEGTQKTLLTLGQAFVDQYMIPMQIAGVLLTAAFIGAALIARGGEDPS